MDDSEGLAHAKWECKAHVVWIPKYRRQALYAELRKYLGPVLRELARQREAVVEEGHLQVGHVHMLLPSPPKYAVAQVLGDLKGKSVIHIARTYLGRRPGQHFWARGYYVCTVGRNEAAIREYLRRQQAEDQRLDQLETFGE